MFNAKDVKPIKEIVDWLNKEFPTNSGKKLFAAYFEKGTNIQIWHIGCEDMFVYMSEDFKIVTEAVREVYPSLKIVFCHLYCVWMYVLNKRKETHNGTPVILIK